MISEVDLGILLSNMKARKAESLEGVREERGFSGVTMGVGTNIILSLKNAICI